MFDRYLPRKAIQSNLELFQTELRESPWFWVATCFTVGNATMLLLEALLRHFVLGQWAYLGLVFLLLAGGLVRSLSTYRSVRSLGLDWSGVDPDSPLAHTLTIVARDIELVPLQLNFAVFIVVFFFTFKG